VVGMTVGLALGATDSTCMQNQVICCTLMATELPLMYAKLNHLLYINSGRTNRGGDDGGAGAWCSGGLLRGDLGKDTMPRRQI
jgi:hypothetical protein